MKPKTATDKLKVIDCDRRDLLDRVAALAFTDPFGAFHQEMERLCGRAKLHVVTSGGGEDKKQK